MFLTKFFAILTTILAFQSSLAIAQVASLSGLLPGAKNEEDGSKNQIKEEEKSELSDPGIKNVYDLAQQILDFAEDSEKQINQLGPSADIISEINFLHLSVQQRLLESGRLGVTGNLSSQEIITLRVAVESLSTRLIKLEEELAAKIEAGDNLQKTWNSRKSEWKKKKEALKDNAAKKAASELFLQVENSFSKVSEEIDGNLAKIIESKQKVDSITEQFEVLKQTVDFHYKKFKASFWQKNAPHIFAVNLSFSAEDFKSWFDLLLKRPMFDLKLWATYKFYFFAQIFLFVVFFAFLSGLRNRVFEFEFKYPLIELSSHLLFALVFTIPNLILFRNPPPDGFLALTSFLSYYTLWKVSEKLLRERSWNIAFRLSITLLFLSKLMQFLELPANFTRLYLIIVSLLVIFYFGRKVRDFQSKDFQLRLLIICGNLFGFFICIAQVLGFVNLSLHVFESVCISVGFAFFIVMFSRVGQGLMQPFIKIFLASRSKMVESYKDDFLRGSEKVIAVSATLFVFWVLLRVWDIANEPKNMLFEFFELGFEFGGTQYTLGLFLLAVAVFYVFVKASQFSQVFLSQEIYPRRGMEKGTGVAINRLIHYFIVLVAFLASCSIVGFELKNVAFIGGAIGIGIGFGLQTIINNFVSGLILLMERSIKVGDTVIIDDQWGTIVKIGLRATVMETLEKSEITVPNSKLVTESVINWTLSNRAARIEIEVGVAYGSDVETVRQILQQIADEHRRVKKVPKPQALFHQFGDSSLIFRIRAWIYNIDEIFDVKSDLHFAIEEAFKKEGIQIPFPQRDVHLIPMDNKAS